jgi:hypothetical protein
MSIQAARKWQNRLSVRRFNHSTFRTAMRVKRSLLDGWRRIIGPEQCHPPVAPFPRPVPLVAPQPSPCSDPPAPATQPAMPAGRPPDGPLVLETSQRPSSCGALFFPDFFLPLLGLPAAWPRRSAARPACPEARPRPRHVLRGSVLASKLRWGTRASPDLALPRAVRTRAESFACGVSSKAMEPGPSQPRSMCFLKCETCCCQWHASCENAKRARCASASCSSLLGLIAP